MKKKALFLFVILLSVVALTGCGKGSMVGEYKIVEASESSTTYKGDDLKKYGINYTLSVKSDGTAIFALGDNKEELTYDDNYFYSKDDKTNKVPYKFNNGKITLEEDGLSMTFAKK